MSNRNGKGPDGKGPTGRQAGPCSTDKKTNKVSLENRPRRGVGRGQGRNS